VGGRVGDVVPFANLTQCEDALRDDHELEVMPTSGDCCPLLGAECGALPTNVTGTPEADVVPS
jgi:hypothetical protein